MDTEALIEHYFTHSIVTVYYDGQAALSRAYDVDRYTDRGINARAEAKAYAEHKADRIHQDWRF